MSHGQRTYLSQLSTIDDLEGYGEGSATGNRMGGDGNPNIGVGDYQDQARGRTRDLDRGFASQSGMGGTRSGFGWDQGGHSGGDPGMYMNSGISPGMGPGMAPGPMEMGGNMNPNMSPNLNMQSDMSDHEYEPSNRIMSHAELRGGPSCIDVSDHVKSCPVCSRLYANDRTVWIICVVVLAIICLLLLKKTLEN